MDTDGSTADSDRNYAGLLLRICAMVVDLLILSVVQIPVMLVPMTFMVFTKSTDQQGSTLSFWGFCLTYIVCLIASLIYFCFF